MASCVYFAAEIVIWRNFDSNEEIYVTETAPTPRASAVGPDAIHRLEAAVASVVRGKSEAIRFAVVAILAWNVSRAREH